LSFEYLENDYLTANIKAYEKSKSVTSDSFGQLKVSGHDCDSFGMNGTQVGIFEERDEVSFSSFLKGQDSRRLESKFLFPFVSDLSDHSLEGEFSNEKIS